MRPGSPTVTWSDTENAIVLDNAELTARQIARLLKDAGFDRTPAAVGDKRIQLQIGKTWTEIRAERDGPKPLGDKVFVKRLIRAAIAEGLLARPNIQRTSPIISQAAAGCDLSAPANHSRVAA